MLLCPACMVELHITERQNVEIDYCPQCRGVWLERGELDKIIEHAAATGLRQGDAAHDPRGGSRRRSRQSFLEERFDFG